MSRVLDEAHPHGPNPAPMKQFRGFPASQSPEIGGAPGVSAAA